MTPENNTTTPENFQDLQYNSRNFKKKNTSRTPEELQKHSRRIPEELQFKSRITPEKLSKNSKRTPEELQNNSRITPEELQKLQNTSCTFQKLYSKF